MRRKRNLNLSDDEPVLDISSLIDVCFLLLIYFLVTSTILPREQDLPMTLPGPNASTSVTLEDMIRIQIGVKSNGSIVMNSGEDEEVLDTDVEINEIPQTKERLKMMNDLARSNGSELFVEIVFDKGVTHQRFIDVLNCLKGEGLNKMAIRDL